jgi:peptidyl-dipeptidase Dcp
MNPPKLEPLGLALLQRKKRRAAEHDLNEAEFERPTLQLDRMTEAAFSCSTAYSAFEFTPIGCAFITPIAARTTRDGKHGRLIGDCRHRAQNAPAHGVRRCAASKNWQATSVPMINVCSMNKPPTGQKDPVVI